MLSVVRGTDNGRQKIMVMAHHCGRKLFTGARSPRKLITLNPKLKSTGAGPLPTTFPLVGCLPQAAWPERLLRKSQDAVALQQIKERGALPMIDRGDIRRAIDRCSNILGFLPGAGYSPVIEHKAVSLIAKFKRSGRNGQKIDV